MPAHNYDNHITARIVLASFYPTHAIANEKSTAWISNRAVLQGVLPFSNLGCATCQVGPSVASHRHDGILPDYYSSVVSVGSIHHIICLHICLPVFLENLHNRQQMAPPLSWLFIMYVNHINIQKYGIFQGIQGPWEPRCNKHGVNDTKSDAIIP